MWLEVVSRDAEVKQQIIDISAALHDREQKRVGRKCGEEQPQDGLSENR
jgi:hypothetical protein